MSKYMSHIATNCNTEQIVQRHYSGRAFLISRFYTRSMALRIKKLRENRGWTQQELAERAGMSRSQLAMIEAETRPANTLRLNAIAAALDVAPEELFDSGAEEFEILRILRALSADEREMLVKLAETLAAKHVPG